ncbi:MAG: AMP phosphorylase [Candidatus Komeilibacteria bacterium]
MPYYLKTKRLDIETGQGSIALLNEQEAWHYGIRAGDKIRIFWAKKFITAEANTTKSKVLPGQIGLYKDIWNKKSIPDETIVEVDFQERPKSIQAIQKRLQGKRLTYPEIYEIMSDIVNDRLSKTQLTYFVASGYANFYSDDELYYLTKAMAETGDCLKFRGIVADKHSIGGLAGNRTTMIVVPIIAANNILIPKTSSRAITSPSGTADTMEVLAPVTFSTQQIRAMVRKNKACIVWGGGMNLAPADDKILRVAYPIALEPVDKAIVSIMAKKVAAGVTHLVIDIPVGPTTKVKDMKLGRILEAKFKYVAHRFKIKIKVILTQTEDPVGFGVGPALEARDVLRVLQQSAERPGDLENKSIHLAGELLELVGKVRPGEGAKLAWKTLESGAAWKKMQDIIKTQGGKPNIEPNQIVIGAHKHYINAVRGGKIFFVDNQGINTICRILGAPADHLAGIYLNKQYGEHVKKGERLFTLYATTQGRIHLALEALKKITIFKIK